MPNFGYNLNVKNLIPVDDLMLEIIKKFSKIFPLYKL
jgi:hypothetical protein